MDFAKFISLLDSSSLYLARLGSPSIADPREGRFGEFHMLLFSTEAIAAIADAVAKVRGQPTLSESGKEKVSKTFRDAFNSLEAHARDCMFISCWHMNEVESDAMWRIYSSEGAGIAVVSTFDRLERSMQGEPKDLYAGAVTYKYNLVSPHETDPFDLVLYKRNSFEHERELRIVCEDASLLGQMNKPNGVYAAVDLKILIQAVMVSPMSPPWIADLIRRLLARFDLSAELVHPSLLYHPLSGS